MRAPWQSGIGPNDIRCDECGNWYNQDCSRCEYCGANEETYTQDDIDADIARHEREIEE